MIRHVNGWEKSKMQLQHLSLGSMYYEGQQGTDKKKKGGGEITINSFYISFYDSHNLGIYSATCVIFARWSKKKWNNNAVMVVPSQDLNWTPCKITYTECHRRNGPNFWRVFLMLNYTDITQNTDVQSWTVSEITASEVWNFDSCYTLIDYQIHIETGRNMWFL